ncbi:hypothetical protein Syun_019320 [Stephania yunnanensis]|uniref:Mitochondrial carrier protein n=1 Tax=Stephania yunnanensis TaxID=152371 RepID=A0AAP0NWK1_9MAGN
MVGGGSRHNLTSWMGAAASRAGFDRNMAPSGSEAVLAEDDNGFRSSSSSSKSQRDSNALLDFDLGIGERAFSAAGAAVLSAILVNPLDVVKTRLQAQAAGVLYSHNQQHVRERVTSFRTNPMYSHLRCSASCTCAGFVGTEAVCPLETFQYKGTLDVFFKIIHQVGIYLPCYDIFRNRMENLTKRKAPHLTPYVPLVAGSMARSLAVISCYPVELARTRMQAFKEIESGVKPPGVWKTLLGVVSPIRSSNNIPNYTKELSMGIRTDELWQRILDDRWGYRGVRMMGKLPTHEALDSPRSTCYFFDLEGLVNLNITSLIDYSTPAVSSPLLGSSVQFYIRMGARIPLASVVIALTFVPAEHLVSIVMPSSMYVDVFLGRGAPAMQGYCLLWTGVGAQLARDVPFSAICWSTLEPVRRRILNFVGEDVNASTILGANFSAGFLAGSIAATVTCPLDVAKTRRQIEKDPSRALSMNTRLTLIEVWRNGGMKGLFTGVGPRIARVGPSTGIVVSFYEVVKYMLHQRQASQGNVIE